MSTSVINMTRMEIGNISANMHLSDEQVAEAMDTCGITPIDGTISLEEVRTLMGHIQENDPARWSRDLLEHLVSHATLFIDTCELLHDQFPTLIQNLTPLLKTARKKLYIPSGVEFELKKKFFNSELTDRVESVLQQLEALMAEGIVAISGNNGESFADQQMLTIAAASLLSEDTVFITRDTHLSEDLLSVNSLTSVQGKKVAVYRINKYGFLSKYKTNFAPRTAIA